MLILMSIVVPLVIGLILYKVMPSQNIKDMYGRVMTVTKPELALGSIVVICLALFVCAWVGPSLARNGAVSGYKEFYNGSVVDVRIERDVCKRDGSCYYEYDCDSYNHVHESTSTDSKGNTRTTYHNHTHYHECPYATVELDYVVKDNLGRRIAIGSNYFEANPRKWRSSGREIPGDVPREPPTRWLTAKQHLASGMSDPVTGVFKYANYILPSDADLLKNYSDEIDKFKQAGVMPKHTESLGDNVLYDYDMRAQKLQVVGGLQVSNLPLWQQRLMQFNAALGSAPSHSNKGKAYQGDLHMVLLPASKVSSPDDYITALKAYWQSLGKWSISKNGIILALGVSPDGSTVSWARAETGMPIGNGEMKNALKLQLVDAPFTPDALLGDVRAAVNNGKPSYSLATSGSIGQIVFIERPFKRPCMECSDKDDEGVGFVDLKDLVPVSTGAKILMFFIVLVLSCGAWWALLAFDPLGAAFPNASLSRTRSSNSFDRFN